MASPPVSMEKEDDFCGGKKTSLLDEIRAETKAYPACLHPADLPHPQKRNYLTLSWKCLLFSTHYSTDIIVIIVYDHTVYDIIAYDTIVPHSFIGVIRYTNPFKTT